jgi:hypothetical protein
MAVESTESSLAELGAPETTVEERRAALSRLLAARTFQRNIGAPEVQGALDAWSELVSRNGAIDPLGLVAVSEIVRMGASAPVISAKVNDLLQRLLVDRLPAVDLALESDVRLNVARAIRLVMPDWAAEYAAHAIASEEKGDKARAEFATVLVEARPSFGGAVDALREAFGAASFPTDDPAKVSARRGARAMDEVRKALVSKALSPGDDFGSALDALSRTIVPDGQLKDEAIAIEFALQIISFVQIAVRSRLSTATMPDTFLAVRRARRLFQNDRWPAQLQETLQPLAADIKEAIVILAKQGVASQALHLQLETVLGSRELAKQDTSRIATETPDIPEDVKHFLVHWKAKLDLSPTGKGVEETALQQLDSVIADSLRHELETRPQPAQVGYVEESVSVFDPVAFATFQQVLDRSEKFHGVILELAKRRRLSLLGNVGEAMQASAKYFTSKSGMAESIVIRPAVVRLRPDGSPGTCIVKGQLE